MFAGPLYKSIFSHLLLLCLASAVVVCIVATGLFYNYRHQLNSDRIAVELTNTARSLAPLLLSARAHGHTREVRQIFRVFAAFPYIRCLSLRQNDIITDAWPAPVCIQHGEADALIRLPIGAQSDKWHINVVIDVNVIQRAVIYETLVFSGIITLIVLLVFFSFAASFRHVVMRPLDRLKAAMSAATPETPVLAKLVRDDEIGALVTVYNKLAATSRYYMRQLAKSQKALQDREKLLNETNRNLNDSMQYASNIQRALLTSWTKMAKVLGKTVVIWQPKDFVGGDFYWFKAIKGRQYLVFFDCTGHGVPGAFMTMIASSCLEQIAVSAKSPPLVQDLLGALHRGVCDALDASDDGAGTNDGLDCAVLGFNDDMSELDFVAASMDLYVVLETGEATRFRGNRISLGYGKCDLEMPTESQTSQIGQNGFVIASDGIITQVGAVTSRAFGSRRFAESLDKSEGNDPAKLVRQLAQDLNQWQGDEARRDDVTVLAFKPASQ